MNYREETDLKKQPIATADVQRLEPSADIGLTAEQVQQRIAAGLANTPVKPPSKSLGAIIASNVFTYFNFIFVAIAVLLLVNGCYKDLTFMPVIIINTLIGIVQETRSKKLLDKMTMLNSPTTMVVRDGEQKKIKSDLLVADDIVVFKAGDQIPADAVVVEGKASVNEALLTGEADEIVKENGAELMSGSYIVSGSCKARLTKVGAESYISQLTIQAKKVKKGEQSEMIRSLNKIVKFAGFIIIPIGAALFYNSYVIKEIDYTQSIRTTVASVIGMIPEGLFLLASVTLAISAMRLARQKVLVHNMKCIETLARTDVLCVDKTGTITENTMQVTGLRAIGDVSEDELFALLSDFAAEQSADNITMAALKKYFTKPTAAKIVSHTDFSSEFKYSSVTFEKAAYVLGAPEWIMRDKYEQYREKIELDSRKGYRVLAFAKYDGKPDGKALTGECEPVALVLITNPVRETAPATFKFFADEGVEVKVISGDNPITVSEVAKQAGIANAEHYVDASTLTTDEAIYAAMKNYTVFGRVTPDQKRKFVRALQSQDKVVAMTGDGVNDILALKDADCSIAMASGSDAAVQAAQLVLLDSDFAHMTDVVMEGRQVVNNLERSGSLFLVKNIFSILLSIITILFGFVYPLTPPQITLIGAFTIGMPAFLLSQVPDHFLIKGHFMRNVLVKALPGGVTDVLVVVIAVIFGRIFEVSQGEIATASTILLSVVGIMVLRMISKPMSIYKWGILALSTVGIILAFTLFGWFFGTTSLSTKSILLCINFGIMADTFLRFFGFLIRGAERLTHKISSGKEGSEDKETAV